MAATVASRAGSLALAGAGKLADLLYPLRCASCQRFGSALCEACLAACVPALGDGRCGHCSAAWEWPDFCPRCSTWDVRHGLDGALAAFDYAGPAREAVWALKYGRQRVVAQSMAEAIRPLWDLAGADCAVAIPLHRSRQKRRGFNQAESLLKALAWPAMPGKLRRTRKTTSQVGMSLLERRLNVEGAFAYEGPELDGRRVALIDDVITTGATANECARVLRDYGVARVVAVAFTRASHPRNLARPVAD